MAERVLFPDDVLFSECDLIPYREAEKILRERFSATTGEIAMWILNGSLHAFIEDGDECRRFAFERDGMRYKTQLRNVYFPKRTITKTIGDKEYVYIGVHDFTPDADDRYLTHNQLLQRWGGLKDELSIRELCSTALKRDLVLAIDRRELIPYHPVHGITDQLEESLFRIDQIEAVEKHEGFVPHTSNKSRPVNNTVKAEKDCEDWLAGLMSNGRDKEKRRDDYFEEAKNKFHIGTRAFDRAWARAIKKTGRSDWSKSGRWKKS